MPRDYTILTRQVAGFSGRCGYDVSHLQGLIAAARAGAVKELLVGPFIQYRFGLPSAGLLRRQDLCYPAADYGSFLKFAIDMAVEAGLPLVAIRQLLLGPATEAPPETRLVAAYALAVAESDPGLREVIEECARRSG